MYKNIIPGLVSFDTVPKRIHGFEMCQNLDFFKGTVKKNKFHYKLILGNTPLASENYDFRSEYFVKKDNKWYYDRKIFFWRPAFCYDFKNRIFYCNKAYFSLPLKIGGVFTLGEHISNIINLELFLDGYVILRGIAVRINNQNIGISAPGLNGKTTLLKKLLEKGAKYIAEDYLILNLKDKKIYPSCPLLKENFWRRRRIDSTLSELLKKNPIIENPVSIDNLYLVQNSQNPNYHSDKKQLVDCLLLNSLYFLDDLFIKSYIYDMGTTSRLLDRVNDFKNISIKHKFVQIHDFNFNFLSKG